MPHLTLCGCPADAGTCAYPSLHRAPRRHVIIGRLIFTALVANARDIWDSLSAAVLSRLHPAECGELVVALLPGCDRDGLDEIISMATALQGAEWPEVVQSDAWVQAAAWGDLAGHEQLRAILVVSFNRLPREEQRAFLAQKTREVA